MKKIFLFLLLAVASGPAAFAQAAPGGAQSSKDYTGGAVTESGNTGFGVKGGYNLSGIRGDDVVGLNRNSLSSFHAGVYGQFGFNDFSSIQAELLYSRQGFSADFTPTGSSTKTTQTFHLDYVSLPIMYVGNFTDNFSFHVGPQVSLLVNANNGSSLDFAANGIHSFDYGGVGGLEARFGPARLGARYNLSLGKLFKSPDNPNAAGAYVASQYKNSNIYNNLLQVYVGFGFTQ
ncbi:porin family protein [Hymenobacter properus]|uniref:PorT family protein n=1 Tax=Hymenobacter properus TaxID=2791026 RepID=A0A931FMN3_9BACT|nr:porin family protein [Hymenobacter properus]MBF9141839.1 PorT family protein [Hymenobacter properus]MBR7720647.1 PorT family protein [Microvirga sp. SRT04]